MLQHSLGPWEAALITEGGGVVHEEPLVNVTISNLRSIDRVISRDEFH